MWKIRDIRCPYRLGDFVYKMSEPKDYEHLLLCDGSTISEENYPELVAVLGGTQLPNLIDRFLQGGATAGTYKAAGLPNITGSHQIDELIKAFPIEGAFYYYDPTPRTRSVAGTNDYSAGYIKFDASRSSAVYGNSTTVQPPSYTAKIYICYAG